MIEGYFSIERDIEIEKAGGFFCLACVVGKPASEQSSDLRYCLSCFDVLKAEAEMQPSRRVAWMPRIVKKTTRVNISRETAPAATQTAPGGQEVVSKIVQPIIPPSTNKSALLKRRGRPKKEGPGLSKATKWRRAKQGALL